MLSYQHGFHAGNYADVVKHLVLTRVLCYLTQKDKPLCYIDTHAGRGHYDLYSHQARKTGEAQQGIAQLWPIRHTLPALFQPYIRCIETINTPNTLRFYPGSPLIASQLLRNSDRLICCEKHPAEFEALQAVPLQTPHTHCLQQDGMQALKAHMPPKERRGLIFMDPSFEVKTDYKDMALWMKEGLDRFATGTFCLWYPIVDNRLHQRLLRNLSTLTKSHLSVEFYLSPTPQAGMWGCGLWIINPPYTLREELQIILPVLRALFNPQQSSFIMQ